MVFLTNRFGITSEVNSSTTLLQAGSTFTGQAEDVSNYGTIKVYVQTDVNSADGGVSLEFSTDGITWTYERVYNYFSSTPAIFNTNIKAKYFRVRYTTAAVGNQTVFNLHTTISQSTTVNGDGDVFIDFSSKYVDSFNRLRVATPVQQIEMKTTVDKNNRIIDEAAIGGATGIYEPNESAVLMSVFGSGDKIIRQTRQRGYYEAGKSLLIICTGVLNPGGLNGEGVYSRIGYFDDQDGIFIEYDGDKLYLAKRKNGSTNYIEQIDFNLDRINGSGPSGFTIDITKSQIFFWDLQWLGVGTIRFGIYSQGNPILVHKFAHANIITGTYMKSANLPIRYELESEDGSGSLRTICSTVIVDGGQDANRIPGSINTGYTTKLINGPTPVLSIRKGMNGYPQSRDTLRITGVSMAQIDNVPATYSFYLSHNHDTEFLQNPVWQEITNTASNYNMRYDVDASGFNPLKGHLTHSCFVGGHTSVPLIERNNTLITSSIETIGVTGISDIFTVVITPLNGATGSYFTSINYDILE